MFFFSSYLKNAFPKRLAFFVLLSFISSTVFSQAKATAPSKLARPKLVVGIVVDQMRWDYLYRFYDRYGETGFKRLLNQGFSCENYHINYLPSATSVGHSSIYTGSVPAIHGITGNDFIDRATATKMYCVGDSTVNSVGAQNAEDGRMSPRNLLASTVTDELMLATNFQSRVVGISLKDRASVLPAGHTPTSAFWLDDKSGNFITSTYYMKQLPEWVTKFNSEKHIEKLIADGWNTLYPVSTYTQSTADDVEWEGRFKGEKKSVFPHDIANIYKTAPGAFRQTPFGNTLTLDFARAAIDAYKLGNGSVTDFLAINCASTDYTGHMFGPNSIEVEDVYLRLDKDLGSFFTELDKKVGKGNYLVFLTADHGASANIRFNQQHNIPSDATNTKELQDGLNKFLKDKFGADKLVSSIFYYQVFFDHDLMEKKKINFDELKTQAIDYLRRQDGISFAIDLDHIETASVPESIKAQIINGYYFKRSGDIQIINQAGWLIGGYNGASHGTYSPYDTHLPLIFMGWGVRSGYTNREIHVTDVAPTISSFLHIQAPNGSIGKPITELVK